MITIKKSILLLMIAMIQLSYAAKEVIATRQNNRFTATIDVSPSKANDMIESASLSIQWWGLMGQPVYYYTFKWNIKDRIDFFQNDRGHLDLEIDELKPYPKLLKRYQQLKPLDIEIDIWVSLLHNSQTYKGKDYQSRKELQELSYLKFGIDGWNEFTFNKTLKYIPEFMIVSSGQTGDNITPASPKDFFEFVGDKAINDLSFSTSLIENRKTINEKLALTYKLADEIKFNFAKISKIELPIRELTAIYDALKKAKKKDSKKQQSLDEMLEKGLEDESENNQDSQDLDDFLEGDTFSEASTDKNDFLADHEDAEPESNTKKIKDDFLEASQNSDIFEENIDEIKKITKEVSEFTCGNTWKAMQTGYVDKTGEFIDSFELTFQKQYITPFRALTLSFWPKERSDFISEQDYQYYLAEQRAKSMRAAIKREEEERKEKIRAEQCKIDIEQWKNQIKAQYN